MGRWGCRTTWFLAVRQPSASAFYQWGLTQPHPGLCALKRSTWCVECPGGSERPWPRPGGHVRCSALTYGCPQHWNSSVRGAGRFYRVWLAGIWQSCYHISTVLPVMLFVHQVVTGAESHQMGIVSWCWDGDRPGAAHIRVAQLVGEDLQFIRREVVVIPEHMVMRWPAGSLWRAIVFG